VVDAQVEGGRCPRERRKDAKSETGGVQIEVADRIDEFARKPDLFLGFAQRGIERGSVDGIDLAAGKGNLAGMVVEMRGALRQQDGRLWTGHTRVHHRPGTPRL